MDVCENHNPGGSLCEECGERRLVMVTTRCTNCTVEGGGPLRTFLLANTEFLAFLTNHGINPLAPSTEPWVTLETDDEEIISMEPLEVRVTYAIGDDTITLTVDDDPSVIEVTGGRTATAD
jgi:hypothetical protein